MKIVNLKVTGDYDVYGGRGNHDAKPGEYGWLGNPFHTYQYGREGAIQKYKMYFWKRINADPEFQAEVMKLKDKTVACYCHPKPCHLDVIKAWFDAGCPLKTSE